MLSILLAEHVETLTHDVLEFELRRVYKLSHSEILRSHLIDAKLLHAVDVASYDGLDEIFAIDVHRQHLVVLATHNHVTLATLYTGIEAVLLVLAQEP